jgi:hypothetical protein
VTPRQVGSVGETAPTAGPPTQPVSNLTRDAFLVSATVTLNSSGGAGKGTSARVTCQSTMPSCRFLGKGCHAWGGCLGNNTRRTLNHLKHSSARTLAMERIRVGPTLEIWRRWGDVSATTNARGLLHRGW